MSRGAAAAGLALLALLAACAAPEPPADRACDAAVDNDPAVKHLMMVGLGNPHFALEHQEEMKAARQQARVACLRGRGLAPPGGVERQRPIT